MASQTGEENVATLFGDVHYFYSPENVKPRHHRFDKGSYVYLFENASQRRCRIEIANQPGTDDQDAFEGFLDQTRVKYSHKQECIVSLTVADTVNNTEWHLPTHDPRNENKYHYKLHSLDIYFWTHKDALQFVNGVRRVLPANQVEVLDEPAPPTQQLGMQSVVQNLEQVAISDPQYGNIRNSQDSTQLAANSGHPATTASVTNSTAPASGDLPLPPPPPPPPPPAQTETQTQAPAAFVPMAYNPAAPAAPETIQHREKTPPPDEELLNPLAVAVAHDYQGQPFTPGLPPSIGSPGYVPGGMMTHGMPPPPPPPQPGIHRAATMPVQNHPGLAGSYASGSHEASPAPSQQAQQATVQQNTTMSPLSSPGLPQAGYSGFSNYTYSPAPQQQQQQQQVPHGHMDYSIHQQVYIPSAAEGTDKKQQQPYVPKQESRGKLEENAARFERGVSGMFKKFEKKFG